MSAADDGFCPSSPKVARLASPCPARADGLATLRIAFIGNSFTFMNDLPHLVQEQLQQNFPGKVQVGACLRGGASFASLWRDGADLHRANDCIGRRDMFATVAELLNAPGGWDAVVLQDFSQGPARTDSRQESLDILASKYIPALSAMQRSSRKKPLVMLFETWGYEQAVKGSEEIGDFTTMTRKLAEGYLNYASLLEFSGFATTMVNAGAAFEAVHDREPDMWATLYQPDHYHVTAKATFLVACLFTTAIMQYPSLAKHFPGRPTIRPSWPDAATIYRPAKADDDNAVQKPTTSPDKQRPTDGLIAELLSVVGMKFDTSRL